VRLCAVPDPAPPYDDEALVARSAHTASAGDRGHPGTVRAGDRGSSRPGPASLETDSLETDSQDRGGQDRGSQGTDGGGGSQEPDPAITGESARGQGATPGWPSQFAQVLAETLAGARPPGQIVPWTTQRARSNIQRLGPTLTAGQPTARQRPLVRRVVTSRPSCDVLEMTVIVGFGPRIRALAVRLERSTPRSAAPGQAARAARWLCTAVEAA
jgi:hypothetical protein